MSEKRLFPLYFPFPQDVVVYLLYALRCILMLIYCDPIYISSGFNVSLRRFHNSHIYNAL